MPKIVIPKAYRCPITGLIIQEPVYISNEKNNPVYYEESALQLWYEENGTHPKTNIKLTSLLFQKSPQFKKEIKDFLKNNFVCSEEEFLMAFLTGDVNAVEKLNYLDSYASLKLDGQSLLHIAVQNKNLRMVEWLLEQGCNVNLLNNGQLPIEIAVQNEDLAIQHLLIIYGSKHAPLNLYEMEMILDCRIKGHLIITDESELQILTQILTLNDTLIDLTLEVFPLSQGHLDAIKLIFDENETLRRFDIYSKKRSYTKTFQSEIDRNNEKQELTGLYLHKTSLEELGIFLPVFLEDREQEVEWVQKKTAELMEFLFFKLPFKELNLSEKEDCYHWIIYFLAMETPCEIYRQLINRVMKEYVRYSLEDIHVNNPQVLVWSEKSFKRTYIKIQKEYKDYFKFKKITLLSPDKELSFQNYLGCVTNLINLVRLDRVDVTFAENCLGFSRFRLLIEGFIPLYLKESSKNSVRFFSKRLNRFRALIEAKEQNYICPISGQIMNFPVEMVNGITYEHFHIEAWLKRHNVDYVTKKALPLNIKLLFPKNELLPRIEEWRKKFGICMHEFFIAQLERGDLKVLKKLNYLEYYLHNDLDNGANEFPICIAARHGYWDIVKWLVTKRVSVNVFSTEGKTRKTPLDWAIYHGNIEIVEWMMFELKMEIKSEVNDPVWLAASNQQLEMLDFLLQIELLAVPLEDQAEFKSEWIKIQDDQQNTLLHLAVDCPCPNLEWIKQLVARGVGLNIQNISGNTVLHLAVLSEQVEVMLYLLAEGANLNIQNFNAETPFDIARRLQYVDIQNCLILHGAVHPYLGNGQLAKILASAGERAEIHITSMDEFIEFTGMLPSMNLIALKLTYSIWREEDKALFLSALSNNKKLQHLELSGLELTIEDLELYKPYPRNNQIAYEKQCLNPYKNYWGILAPLFEHSFKIESLGNKKVSEVIADLIHFIAFTLPFDQKENVQKACYEWIIYVLFNEPLIEGKLPSYYYHLLKLAFLFLIGRKSPQDYFAFLTKGNEKKLLDRITSDDSKELEGKLTSGDLKNLESRLIFDDLTDLESKNLFRALKILEGKLTVDDLILKKDFWVWSEQDFKDVYFIFEPCQYLNEINLNAPVSIEAYNATLDQMIDLLKQGEDPFKKNTNKNKKVIEKLLLLKIGFKPLYLKAQGKNAEIVFDPEFNFWRASIYRLNISKEAMQFQNEQGLLNWELDENSEPIADIQNLRDKYGIYYLKEFWSVFEKNPWLALASPNYFETYLVCVDLDGNSLVHIAVRKQDLNLIEYLYEIQCDIDSPNHKGLTPLHLAIEKGCMDIFDFLYERVKITSEKGTALLHYAFINSRMEFIQKLISAGFTINGSLVDEKGRSVLYLALKNKRQDMLSYLFENWSDVAGEIDKESIFLALDQGYKEIISIFIEKGCSFDFKLDFKNEKKITPLHYAIKLGNLKIYLDIAKLLIQQGCNLEARDGLGKTPLDYAKDLLKLNSKSTFWHILIRKGASHDSLSKKELKEILCNARNVKLTISCPNELKFLVGFLKNNAFPGLKKLHLNFYGNAYVREALLNALQNNYSLMVFTFYENDTDYSQIFNTLIERNCWMAHLKPYEEDLRRLGIKLERIFSTEELAARSVPKILADILKSKIFDLPLDELAPQGALIYYRWLIDILSAQSPIDPEFNLLLAEALNKILIFQRKEYIFHEKYRKKTINWSELIALWEVWVCSEEECEKIYNNLKIHCSMIDLPPYTNYQDAMKIFVDLFNDGEWEEELCECLGKDRVELIKLNFIPVLSSPEDYSFALKIIQQYYDFIQLSQLSDCLEPTFPNIHSRLNTACLNLQAFPLDQKIMYFSKVELMLYKMAAIVSYEDYWKCRNKNKKKLNKGIQVFKEIFLSFSERSGEGEVLECLKSIREVALNCLKKESEIFFKFFPVRGDDEVNRLYQYLVGLDLEVVDLNLEILDDILERIWEFLSQNEEGLNLNVGIKIEF